MSSHSPSAPDQALLTAALALADCRHTDDVLDSLRPALASLPQVGIAGISTFDEERGVARRTLRDLPQGRRFDPIEVPVAQSVLAPLRNAPDAAGTVCLDLGKQPPPLPHLHATGAARLLIAPLRIQTRLIGGLFVGLGSTTAGGAPERDFLLRAARIISPAVWTMFTHERFARGDRRRDTLIKLMTALNVSHEPEAIIAAAKAALDSVEPQAGGLIELLTEDRHHVRRYARGAARHPRLCRGDEPHRVALRGSLVGWLAEHPRTYGRRTSASPVGFRRMRLCAMRAFGVTYWLP